MPEISENAFEQAIENVLVTVRSDGTSGDRAAEPTPGYGEFIPGGYHRRTSADYEKDLCLIPQDVLDFILATQPKEWGRLKEYYGEDVKKRFLRRLVHEVERQGIACDNPRRARGRRQRGGHQGYLTDPCPPSPKIHWMNQMTGAAFQTRAIRERLLTPTATPPSSRHST